MALDRSPDLPVFAHRFYVLVLFFSVLVIPKCCKEGVPHSFDVIFRPCMPIIVDRFSTF